MLRLMFSKTGNAVWISHLDTMRLFQRAFKRCGFHLKHTQGFNPRPSVSIALPLSVGVESHCELLDFELEDTVISCSDIENKLNNNLIDGVRVRKVYEHGAKIKHLKYLQCEIDMIYDGGIPENAVSKIGELFRRTELPMEKKGKNGITSQDIIPMIRKIDIDRTDDNKLCLSAVICCQEPSLNPLQLNSAVMKYLPECAASYVKCRRCELLDAENQIFR